VTEEQPDRVSAPTLVMTGGPLDGTVYPLTLVDGETILGSSMDAGVQIMLGNVEPFHARILVGRDGLAIEDAGSATGTFVATLAFAPNIQNGILTGILLSLALLMYRMMRPRVAVLGMHQDATLRDAQQHNLPPLHPKLGALRFDGALRFVNVSYFEDAMLKLERENPNISHVLVTCGGINDLDASGVEMLLNLIRRFKNNNITLTFSGIKKQVHAVMERTKLIEAIGTENIFPTDRDALDQLYQRLEHT